MAGLMGLSLCKKQIMPREEKSAQSLRIVSVCFPSVSLQELSGQMCSSL